MHLSLLSLGHRLTISHPQKSRLVITLPYQCGLRSWTARFVRIQQADDSLAGWIQSGWSKRRKQGIFPPVTEVSGLQAWDRDNHKAHQDIEVAGLQAWDRDKHKAHQDIQVAGLRAWDRRRHNRHCYKGIQESHLRSTPAITPTTLGPGRRSLKRRKRNAYPDARMSSPLNMPAAAELEDKGMPTIELTEVEGTLKRLLLDVADYIESSQKPPSHTLGAVKTSPIVLRFTGGWVRDKLLGVDSQDIDVGIENMTGYQFGLWMQEYLRIRNNARKYGVGKPEVSEDSVSEMVAQDPRKARRVQGLGGLHKIEANPEKSKHLETVTTRVLGLAIDLVNLRKETYTEHSRNPQMEFGTPEEDALRRDATVNALFYNLNTSTLEDFTGQGLTDMRLKIIRTPLEPHQTFMDDPLRVLRLIRFASRLEYTIDPKTELAMGDDNVRAALRDKISRERIGTELEKMLKGPDPHTALSLIDRLNLYLTIFPPPPRATDLLPKLDHWKRAYDFVHSLMGNFDAQPSQDNSVQTIKSILLRDAQEQYNAWLLATIFPWANVPTEDYAKPGTKAKAPLPVLVTKEGIKATNKAVEIITSACKNANEVASLQRTVVTQTKDPDSHTSRSEHAGRDILGMAIRRWGPKWQSQVFLALLLDVARQGSGEVSNDSSSIVSDYAIFLKHLSDLDLLEAYSLKPLLDGNQLAAALKSKPGPWTKEALELVMAWQLRNPGITDTRGALEEVERHREDLGIK